jgi:hypothetical protein
MRSPRDLSFERYFEYRFDSGQLDPATAATAEDRLRARRTIEVLRLNRPGACTNRRAAVKAMMRAVALEDISDCGYRFLVPLVEGCSAR